MQNMNQFTAERNNCRRRLIMLVKKHPILWNKKQEDYKRNRPRKMQTWQAIADEMGSTSIKIRRTWENLRDQYRRDLKREIKYGFTSKWRFFFDMDFIRDMVSCKHTQTDLTDSDSEIECSELTEFLHEVINPTNTQFVEQRIMAPPSTNPIRITPNITEFQPIILSKQWQQQCDNGGSTSTMATLPEKLNAPLNTKTNSEICLQPCNCFQDTQTNLQHPNVAKPCNSSASKNQQQQQQQQQQSAAIDIIDLEKSPKIEPAYDIEQEPIQAAAPKQTQSNMSNQEPAKELINFQESHVSTSNTKNSVDVTEERSADLEERQHNPRKKRKYSESDLDAKDEDYHFVMSLLPSLRQIPCNKKFALRIGLMNLIAKDLEGACK